LVTTDPDRDRFKLNQRTLVVDSIPEGANDVHASQGYPASYYSTAAIVARMREDFRDPKRRIAAEEANRLSVEAIQRYLSDKTQTRKAL
jgi:hypothetical protein